VLSSAFPEVKNMRPRPRIIFWLTLICVPLAMVALTATSPRPTGAESPANTPEAAAEAAPETAKAAAESPVPAGEEAIPRKEMPTRESFLTADRELPPMLQAIKTAWQEHTVERTQLENELAATSNPLAALDVQRRIEAAAREFELQVLRIQADFARSEGRIEVAERLEAAIAQMIEPPVLPPPVERSAPATNR